MTGAAHGHGVVGASRDSKGQLRAADPDLDERASSWQGIWILLREQRALLIRFVGSTNLAINLTSLEAGCVCHPSYF
jgi:hypothetical protein